jgi:hypothetical protein
MSNNFCRYLSNQVRIEYGYMKPCCWFRDEFKMPLDDEHEVKLFREKLSEITTWEDTKGGCDECYTREKVGLHSPRLESLVSPAFNNVTDNSIVKLEIQIDRDCNAACLICGPWNSSTWEKYTEKVGKRINLPVQQLRDTESETRAQITKLKKILSLDQSKDIRFLGGEPLRNNHHVELLSEIDHHEDITLNYTTNGSYRPSVELLDFWRRFKRVNLTFSIDGVGEHFNYLRWPLQWHQVEDNIRYLAEYNQPNIYLTKGSYTATPFSLYYHDQYVEANEKFVATLSRPIEPWFNRPWEPRGITPMSLSAVPPELAEIIAKKYGPDHSITKLLVPFDPASYNQFKHYISMHDYNRQTNWQKTFPEMAEFYK